MQEITQRWVEIPASLRGIRLAALAQVLSTQQLVSQAWLVGSAAKTADGQELLTTTIALVVDDQRGAAVSPKIVDLIERMNSVASDLGLDVNNWSFVSPSIARKTIQPFGLQIYSAGDTSTSI